MTKQEEQAKKIKQTEEAQKSTSAQNNSNKETNDKSIKEENTKKETSIPSEKEKQLNPEEQLKKDLEEMTETAKRLMADMTNLRRRHDEERIKTILFANANLFKLLLPGLDNLKRALSHIPENSGEWGKGIEMSIRQIEKALEEAGLEKMKTDNELFNPELHQAVLQADGEENKILETLEDGYKIQDFVIRHAKVKIGNGQKN
jgi:molecular chaperone GrpE